MSLSTKTSTHTSATAASTRSAASFIPFDPSFGQGGVVKDFATAFQYRLGLCTLPDGRFLVAGYLRDTDTVPMSFAVARFHDDGRLDVSFGDHGTAVLDGGPASSSLFRLPIAVQPDGRVLVGTVAGSSGQSRWSLIRLTASGRLDPSFSGDGRVQTSFPAAQQFLTLTDILLDDHDRTVVVGFTGESRLCAARYAADGSLDRSFGVEGKATVQLPGARAQVWAATYDADGKIVVAGATERADSRFDLLVARFGPDLTPDPTFGFGGSTIVDFGIGSDVGYRMVLQDDGHIVVAGTTEVSAEAREPALIRLQPDGSPDPTFGNNGQHRLSTGKDPDRAHLSALTLLPDGRIAVGGSYKITQSEKKADVNYRVPQPFVAVLRPDGSADPGFAGTARPVFLGIGSDTSPVEIAAVAEDKLLVASRTLLRLRSSTELAALRLSMGADPNPAGPGPVQFRVTVVNAGDSAAGGVLRLRASKAVSVLTGTNGSYTVQPNRVDVLGKISSLPPGGAAELTLQMSVTGFEEGVSLTGSVTSGSPELDLADNTASILVTVSRTPTL